MANIAKLQRTMDWITANQDQWCQDRWSQCFAGITVQLDEDYDMVIDNEEMTVTVHRNDEYVGSVRYAAQQILGLEGVQAYSLFHATNNLADLRSQVARLCEQEARKTIVEITA